MDKLIDVLVVGAGPSGLTMAADLSRRGLQVRIIDKILQRTDKSKAMGIQAGTLEAFESGFGSALPQLLVKTGRPAREAYYHYEDKTPLRIDVSQIQSKYNFILILEQSETERILEDLAGNYGVFVERGVELVSFTQKNNQVTSNVKTPSGAI